MNQEFYDVAALITDETKEVEGVWKSLSSKASVKVARWGNDNFNRMMRRKYKANRAVMEAEDDVSEKVSVDILIEVMASTVLMDVKGLGFKGKLIEKYTPEIGMELLRVKDFREKIKGFSEDVDSYLAAKEEEAVKN